MLTPVGFVLSALFLSLLLMVVSLVVGDFIVFRSLQDQSAQRKENLPWRLSRGQDIPEGVREAISVAGAAGSDSLHEELQAWLTDTRRAEESRDNCPRRRC